MDSLFEVKLIMKSFLSCVYIFVSLLMPNQCFAQQVKKHLLTAEDGFKWYRLEKGKYMGAEDEFGRTLIPLDKEFTYVQVYRGRFLVNVNNFIQGIYDLKGNEIFSPQKGYDFGSPRFDDKSIFGNYKYYLKSKNKKEGLCDLSGNDIIPCIYDLVAFHEVEGHVGYFEVKKDSKNGVYDIYGKEIIPCIYDFVFYSDINDSFIYEGSNGYISLNISLDSNGCVRGISNSAGSNTISAHTSSSKLDKDYGINSKHGKILNRSSEQQGTITVTKEWYEDGYSSTFIMDKCKACGGTGKVGFNFCTAGCAMGITTLLTYYDQNGNEVESTGTMANHNNPYSSGGSGGSYSGGSSSGSSSSSSSVYTKCTSCNGTGRCSSCNGRGYKFNSHAGHDDECPSCRGKGSCPICYGRGKL